MVEKRKKHDILCSLSLSFVIVPALAASRSASRFQSQASTSFYLILRDATTMSTNGRGAEYGIPVLLLKTKSIPNDGYEEQLSAVKEGHSFEPIFVPVLEHQFLEEGISVVKELLRRKQISSDTGAKYGGLIFTSQRAVEAFAKLVEEGKGKPKC